MPETPPGVDLDRLRPWFAAHVDGATDRPLQASLISGGRSNLTYSIGDGTKEWVLRRPPLGHVLPTAHDMAREYTVLAALAGTAVPVPHTLAFCADDLVNDAPFYVMEKVDGVILRTPDEFAHLSAEDARRCSECLVDVLVEIHAVEYHAVGLGEFGHPDGYVERQVRRWGEQWERSTSRDVPAIEELARRLRAARPVSPPPTIVHGDYRLDNTMLAADDPGRIVAVLDWEMATLGDPLSDLGLFLVYWGRDQVSFAGSNPSTRPDAGFLSRDEIARRYADKSGRDISQIEFYEMLASYKLAIILEGIHARFLMGKTVGEGFDHIGTMVESIANAALDSGTRSSIPALRG
ncbi:MAG: phosphotransferase family protein [Acidimicrobiia bacterium]